VERKTDAGSNKGKQNLAYITPSKSAFFSEIGCNTSQQENHAKNAVSTCDDGTRRADERRESPRRAPNAPHRKKSGQLEARGRRRTQVRARQPREMLRAQINALAPPAKIDTQNNDTWRNVGTWDSPKER
jgi:hypothetical protein